MSPLNKDIVKAAGVRTVEASGGVKSISDIWEETHRAAEMVESSMDDMDPRKAKARADVHSATEKLLAMQFRILNEERAKLVPTPRHVAT